LHEQSSRFNLESGTETEGSLLIWRQELQFNYYIRYGVRIWRTCRSGGASDWKVARYTEHPPPDQIGAPGQFWSEGFRSLLNPEPNTSLNLELWAPDLNWRQDLSSDSIYGKVRQVLACFFGGERNIETFVAGLWFWGMQPNDRVRFYLWCLSRFSEEFVALHGPTLPTRANSWAN